MKVRIGFWFALVLIALALPLSGFAHVGSPDIYYEGNAGPYHLLVTIRPPAVVPGVAAIQVRCLGGDIDRIEILPLTMQGPGASLAPRPDIMQRSSGDPQLYDGNLWIMLRGSWKVQMQVYGKQGQSELAVPVAAVSMTAARMERSIGAFLAAFGLLLVAALISIVRAANGQALLPPRESLTPAARRRAYLGMGIGTFFIVALLVIGDVWWGSEARANERMVYRVPQLSASLQSPDKLMVRLENPNSAGFTDPDWQNAWAQIINMNDLVPDHGHLMHLFLISTPDRQSFWHLHPGRTNVQEFTAELPAVPPGHYQIYADIVHSTGFPETQVGAIELPSFAGRPLTGDDSGGANFAASGDVAQLSDGYRMVWEHPASALHTQQAIVFRFRIEDKDRKPATDLEDYMGMAGHAVFVSDDGKVFAHVHPEGSVSMAALAMAQPAANASSSAASAMGNMTMGPKSAEVSFPYGFPQPGDYHLFVQVKRAGHVETGSFVAHVTQ